MGTSDLRPLFNAFPTISILTIPLLTLRTKRFLTDDSLPFTPSVRFANILIAQLAASCVPLIFLLAVPATVSLFGNVDAAQILSGSIGLIFYSMTAISLTQVFFTFFAFSPALSLILSLASLFAINFIHLIPLHLQVASFPAYLLQKISFAWHFSSSGKGIIDSRDILFYALSTVFFISLCICAEYRRTGRKINRKSALKLAISFALLCVSFSRLYIKFDMSRNKEYSVSKTTRVLAEKLEHPLRITYFRSKELRDLYPQSSDIIDYLENFCRLSEKLSLKIENADSQKLSRLGVQGQQIRTQNSTRTSYITVYSAVLIEYLEKSTVIPFVLSPQNLEYDIAQRLSELISEKNRTVYLISGNGRSFESTNSYIAPYLASRGFMPKIVEVRDILQTTEYLTTDDKMLVFGSSNLSHEQAEAIMEAAERGVKTFIATTPYSVDIEGDWNITKNRDDHLIQMLNSKGFAFNPALVEDISCYPLTMVSGEGNTAEYTTVNYPLWVQILPQDDAPAGLTAFWTSPLSLYNSAKPLLITTASAWLQEESQAQDLFVENPFVLPKTAKESGAASQTQTIAARKGSILVLADQYFTDTTLTSFISSEDSMDLRNYDFIARELLKLGGEEKLAELMSKAQTSKSLYKITDGQKFERTRRNALAIHFILMPVLLLALCLAAKGAFRHEINSIR